MRGQLEESPTIGEVIDQPKPFYDGSPPPILPEPRVCGPLDYFTRGDPNGPKVGLDSCLNAPPFPPAVLPCQLSQCSGIYIPQEGAIGLFTRQDTPQEGWVSDLVGPNAQAWQFLCEDGPGHPVHQVYFLTEFTPGPEPRGWNAIESWQDPFRLIFHVETDLGNYTLTVGNLPDLNRFTVWGIPRCCFNAAVPPVPTSIAQLSQDNPAVLYMLAAIMAATYETTAATAAGIVNAWLGPPLDSAFVPNSSSIIPGMFLVRYNNFAIVWVAGTSNETQLALQAMQFSAGPLNVGQYSTIPLWHIANRSINDRLAALGVATNLPILLVGHSYGGVLAWTLGVDYHLAQPGRDVHCVTFGMPKPGDNRLAALSPGTRWTRVENYGDPIPATPPDLGFLSVWQPFVPSAFLEGWNLFIHGGNSWQLDPAGGMSRVADSPATYVTMAEVLANYLIFNPGLTFTAHGSATYATRLNLATGFPLSQFPVSFAALAAARAAYP